jgi:hypothetical protein
MLDWQMYPNGNLRQPWDLERLARHRATKFRYRVLGLLGLWRTKRSTAAPSGQSAMPLHEMAADRRASPLELGCADGPAHEQGQASGLLIPQNVDSPVNTDPARLIHCDAQRDTWAPEINVARRTRAT